ncbi:MAG TPA: hypothetical protein VF717_09340 [Pyrinomonadaceae bacterium]
MKPFDYHVRGIEDGIITAIKAQSGVASEAVRPYKGELDQEELKKESKSALKSLISRLPFYLIAYAAGYDTSDGSGPIFPGDEIVRVHRCTFTVLCCGSDWRGEAAEKIGVAKMIATAQAAVVGRQFVKTEEIEGGGVEEVILNLDVMTVSEDPPNPEYVVRLPELTAYAVHFDTMFKYLAADVVPDVPIEIEQINFSLGVRNAPHPETDAPGVHAESNQEE